MMPLKTLAAALLSGAVGLAAFASPGVVYRDGIFGFELRLPVGAVVRWGTVPLQIDLPVPPHTTLLEDYLILAIRAGPAGRGSPRLIGSGMEGAAGSRYECRRYLVGLFGGYSLVLTFVLRSADPGVYDRPPPAFDRVRELEEWERILAGLRVFPPGLDGVPGPR